MYAAASYLLTQVHWSKKYKDKQTLNRSKWSFLFLESEIKGFQISLRTPQIPTHSHTDKLIFYMSLLHIHDKSPLRQISTTSHLGALTAKNGENLHFNLEEEKHSTIPFSLCLSVHITWSICFYLFSLTSWGNSNPKRNETLTIDFVSSWSFIIYLLLDEPFGCFFFSFFRI